MVFIDRVAGTYLHLAGLIELEKGSFDSMNLQIYPHRFSLSSSTASTLDALPRPRFPEHPQQVLQALFA